jgi:hypothetical protein
MFLAERRELIGVAGGGRIGQLRFDVLRTRERLGETLAEAQAEALVAVPYFWRKRSTRPAVSMSFCLPV